MAQLSYHLWINVEPYRIDYRGRFWYQLDFDMQHLIEQVPCGVFLPSNFPDVIYQGQAVEIKPLALSKS